MALQSRYGAESGRFKGYMWVIGGKLRPNLWQSAAGAICPARNSACGRYSPRWGSPVHRPCGWARSPPARPASASHRYRGGNHLVVAKYLVAGLLADKICTPSAGSSAPAGAAGPFFCSKASNSSRSLNISSAVALPSRRDSRPSQYSSRRFPDPAPGSPGPGQPAVAIDLAAGLLHLSQICFLHLAAGRPAKRWLTIAALAQAPL